MKLSVSIFLSLMVLAVSPAFSAEEAAPAAAKPVAAKPAAASGAVVSVLDLEAVVNSSEAGKGIQAAIKKREEALKKEAEGYRKTLKEKEKKLIADRKAGQEDKAFADAKKVFEDEVKKSQKAMVEKGMALEKSKRQAMQDIQREIAKVTADIADERKIQIVVDRKFVVIAEQKLDITEEVLKRLNDAVKSIPLK